MIIKIFGSTSEGKSTVAEYLTNCLKSKGIKVVNEDSDIPSLGLHERLQILGNEEEPLKCTIKTIPLKLETLPKYAEEFEAKKNK